MNQLGALQDDVAGVHVFVHVHRGNARLMVAMQDRVLNRRGATPARQQRGVNVDASETWDFQH